MTITTVFLTGVATTGAACLAVVYYLRPHFRRILTELCGNEQRADFWVAFSNVTMFLVPVVFALHVHPAAGQDTPLVFELGDQVKWAMIGLVVSVLTLGIVLSAFIPRQPLKP